MAKMSEKIAPVALPSLNLPVFRIDYKKQQREWDTQLARQIVISRAASYIASDLYLNSEDRIPGPNDGDEMDLKADELDFAVVELSKLLNATNSNNTEQESE